MLTASLNPNKAELEAIDTELASSKYSLVACIAMIFAVLYILAAFALFIVICFFIYLMVAVGSAVNTACTQ